jgi:hypothetical protein
MNVTFDIGVFASLLIAAGAYLFRRESKRNQIRFAIISELGERKLGELVILSEKEIEMWTAFGLDFDRGATAVKISDPGRHLTQIPTDHYENFFNSLYILPRDEVESIIGTYDDLKQFKEFYLNYIKYSEESPEVSQRLEDEMSDRSWEVNRSRESTENLLRERLESRRIFR